MRNVWAVLLLRSFSVRAVRSDDVYCVAWGVNPKIYFCGQCDFPPIPDPFNCASEILLLTYLLTWDEMRWVTRARVFTAAAAADDDLLVSHIRVDRIVDAVKWRGDFRSFPAWSWCVCACQCIETDELSRSPNCCCAVIVKKNRCNRVSGWDPCRPLGKAAHVALCQPSTYVHCTVLLCAVHFSRNIVAHLLSRLDVVHYRLIIISHVSFSSLCVYCVCGWKCAVRYEMWCTENILAKPPRCMT